MKGTSPNGQVIHVPRHRHEVSLDFIQLELGMVVPINEQWDFRFRLPISIKQQRSSIRFVSPMSESERTATLRNRQVHHRSESYQGLGDPTLLLASRYDSVFFNDDVLVLSGGVSVPLGRIEGDPFEAGEAGREHLHIQFGTGSFDPVIEFQYEKPLNQSFRSAFFASGRIPFYENRKRYQAPSEVSSSLSLAWDALELCSVYSGYLFYFQGYGHWGRTGKDENTGLISHNLIAGINLRPETVNVTFEVKLPLFQETLDCQGDTFEPAPSFVVAGAFTF